MSAESQEKEFYNYMAKQDSWKSVGEVIQEFIKLKLKENSQVIIKEYDETELYLAINNIIDGGKGLPKDFIISRGKAIDYAFETALKVSKWQQERSYSKEDMITFAKMCKSYSTSRNVEKVFEQFKKK